MSKNNCDENILWLVSEMRQYIEEDYAVVTNYEPNLYQILCKLFNFRIPSQIYLKLASSF